jgi:polyhydroxybutyrate depolymerase
MNTPLIRPLSIFFAFTLLLSSCSKNVPDECELGEEAAKISINSVERRYILYKPDSLPENSPLIIFLHGRDQNANYVASFGFNAIADTAKFAVCYPQGRSCTWDNDKLGSSDVEFIKQLATQLQADHKFSPQRTYIAGFSEGAALCNIIALEAGDKFAAAAVVSGEITNVIWNAKNPQSPIPILFMHGLNDRVMSISGGGYAGSLPVSTLVDFWKDFDLCVNDTSEIINTNVSRTLYSGGVDDAEVWFYRLKNHQHVFPGDPAVPDSLDRSAISGAQEIWSFFRKF